MTETLAGATRETSVVIVGAGFSGLGMAIKLKQAGIHDFVVLEKSGDLGGTWRDNSYPGCACDVPSLMYSFSFEQNPDWSRMFAQQDEIQRYLQHCAAKYGVRSHIRYGAEFTRAEFDDQAHRWRISTADGTEYLAKALVSGVGALHIPNYPQLPGIERFTGEVFHSARWNHDFDSTGKRVAVVGTGASAIQFVPHLARSAQRLHLFQRTPPWVQPRPDGPIPRTVREAFRRVPGLQRLARAGLYWMLELRSIGVLRNRRLQAAAEAQAKRHISKSIDDPRLREAVTPDYAMGCKRILLSSDYYPALNRSNVDVHTDGIAEVRENSVVTRDGNEYPVDAIVYGTGFHTTDAYDHLTIIGRDGRKLGDVWREGMEAHLGITVAGFPNLFFLLGPNTGLGHNSVVFMIECQIHYVLRWLRPLCAGKIARAEVRPSAQEEFNRGLQSRLNGEVWSQGGCRSWYLDENGVNRTLWPGFSFTYWWRTRRAKPSDYEIEYPSPRERAEAPLPG